MREQLALDIRQPPRRWCWECYQLDPFAALHEPHRGPCGRLCIGSVTVAEMDRQADLDAYVAAHHRQGCPHCKEARHDAA